MSKIVLAFAAALCTPLSAQAPITPEPLRSWPYYKEIHALTSSTGWLSFVLDVDTLDKARADAGDLRLYSASGSEVPYLLRIRRATGTSQPFAGREFNKGSDESGAQVSIDLGEEVQQHNEVGIETAGLNFRRKVDVDGSADGSHWSTLASRALIFRFSVNGPTVEQTSVPYPVSRYRYLRLHVSSDPEVDRVAPEIEKVTVRRTVQAKSELVSFSGKIEGRSADRKDGRSASIWNIDVGGRIPIEGLTLTTDERAFSRPFDLEDVDDPSSPISLSSGEVAHRQESSFPKTGIAMGEHRARRLRLTITDDRNAPLQITAVTAISAAREVLFAPPPPAAGTLRLYYGSPTAIPPHYDLAAKLPGAAPAYRTPLGPQQNNPIYRPDPKPLSERSPWLVYVVLLAASFALALILMSLAREANRSVAEPGTRK